VPQLLLRYHGSGLFKPLNDANKVCVRPKHKNKLDLKRVLKPLGSHHAHGQGKQSEWLWGEFLQRPG
jgi:hypothetical protein